MKQASLFNFFKQTSEGKESQEKLLDSVKKAPVAVAGSQPVLMATENEEEVRSERKIKKLVWDDDEEDEFLHLKRGTPFGGAGTGGRLMKAATKINTGGKVNGSTKKKGKDAEDCSEEESAYSGGDEDESEGDYTGKKKSKKKAPGKKLEGKGDQFDEELESAVGVAGGEQGEGKSKFDKDGNVNYSMFEDPTPYWALKENLMDAKKRRPDHPEYDETSLYIPADELKKLSPGKRQYWIIKSQNFEKLIFFKLGKFYELFDMDAVIGVQTLGLAFMGNKMHAGVPEVALDKFADKLVQLGYKVGIVEQTETARENKTRLSASSARGEEKVLKREMVKVLTKGTYVNPNEDTPKLSANYIWIFKSYMDGYSLCIGELSLNLVWLGVIPKDINHSKLKMLIYQLKPSEVVFDPELTNREVQRILTNITPAPALTKTWHSEKKNFWNSYIMSDKFGGSKFMESLQTILTSFDNQEEAAVAKSTFTGLVNYLNDLRILENHIDIICLRKYDEKAIFMERMVLDSQALEQLEIIEATHDFRTKRDDSLLATLDRCVSMPGKRLLKSIVCSPLLEISKINERLDAIEDLNRNQGFISEIQGFLKNSGDLERTLGKLFKYSLKQKEKYVLFEDISTTRLRELKSLLATMLKLFGLLKESKHKYKWDSAVLKSLTTVEKEGGTLKAGIEEEIKDIGANILWTGDKKDIPVPRDGVNSEYDETKKQIRMVEKELDEYLQSETQRLKCRDMEFNHAKVRFEIALPESVKPPAEYSFSSHKKGYKRYTTPTTLRLTDKLEVREEVLKEHMKVFALYVFEYFSRKRDLWENIVNIAKELDVLCALSLYSFKSRGTFCRPKLHGNDVLPFVSMTAARHPIVSQLNDDFVANDVRLGSRYSDQVVLLTGPNMGGKSTILRQVCLNAIIAQIGCYVPAESAELTVIDRVFTRLGASDALVEGKSTFFIEMEDVYNLVTFGTARSLAIIDELGRGTSTADGYSIAAAILHHIVDRIGCLTFFSTHYHSLINFCLDYDKISFWKMDYFIDEQNGDIQFLYKLVAGICNRSFGIKIGRLAGIEESILQRADEISQQIDQNLDKNFRSEIERKYDLIVEAEKTGTDLSRLDI
jgi:DNA mismatch repair protein MSH6